MIAYALKKHPAKTTAIVPFYAMSGGTLIALAADEIVMEDFAVLGPLDPQIGGLSSGAILGLLEKKPLEAVSDEMVIMGDLAGKAVKEVQSFIENRLRRPAAFRRWEEAAASASELDVHLL